MRTPHRFGLVATLLLALSGSTLAESAGDVPWAALYRGARQAWKRGDLLAAERALVESLRLARESDQVAARERSERGLAKVRRRLEETLTLDETIERLTDEEPEARAGAQAALERHARAGDVQAARILAALYIEGHGLEPDMTRGLDWLDQAIEGGDIIAMIYKAELAEWGLGMPLDRALARDLYRQAAKDGSAEAAYRLGRALAAGGLASEAEPWLRLAAEGGLAVAQVDLGALLYDSGGRDQEAADWFHRAARGGDANGRYSLAVCVLQGRGQVADRELAVEYFQRAAEAGSRAAREALVVLGEEAAAEARTD